MIGLTVMQDGFKTHRSQANPERVQMKLNRYDLHYRSRWEISCGWGVTLPTLLFITVQIYV